MFNINQDNEETKWVDFSDDEKYLVRWISPDKMLKFSEDDKLKDIDSLIDYIVKDWEGIFETKDDKEIKLECNLDNKKLVFDASPSRWSFVFFKSQNYSTFFNIGDYEKN